MRSKLAPIALAAIRILAADNAPVAIGSGAATEECLSANTITRVPVRVNLTRPDTDAIRPAVCIDATARLGAVDEWTGRWSSVSVVVSHDLSYSRSVDSVGE